MIFIFYSNLTVLSLKQPGLPPKRDSKYEHLKKTEKYEQKVWNLNKINRIFNLNFNGIPLAIAS
jgi:hypothetical protein